MTNKKKKIELKYFLKDQMIIQPQNLFLKVYLIHKIENTSNKPYFDGVTLCTLRFICIKGSLIECSTDVDSYWF